MAGVQHKTLTADDDGMRLDRWLKKHYPGLAFGKMQKLIRSGQIRIDGGRAKGDTRLEAGQVLRLPPHMDEAAAGKKKTPRLTSEQRDEVAGWILYEDDALVAIAKPGGLAVQGGSKTHRHLDVIMAAYYYDEDPPPRLCHRLDRDTSGIILFARSAEAAREMTRQFKSREVNKDYLAILSATPESHQGEIRAALRKAGARGEEKMIVDEADGLSARSLYKVLDHAGGDRALVALRPLTGRTHQLRVHMEAIGAPVLGDGKYGALGARISQGEGIADRLYLHAWRLAFDHPITGAPLRIMAPLPEDFSAALSWFGLAQPYEEEDIFPA